MHLLVLGFRDGERPEPDDAGTFIFESTMSMPVLAYWACAAVEGARGGRSDAAWAEDWGHPFPTAGANSLHDYLSHL